MSVLHAAHLSLSHDKPCLSELNHSLSRLSTAFGLQHSREKQKKQLTLTINDNEFRALKARLCSKESKNVNCFHCFLLKV